MHEGKDRKDYTSNEDSEGLKYYDQARFMVHEVHHYQALYVCMCDLYYLGSARNSTYITGLWAVGQKDEALDYTLIAAGC